MTEDVMFWAERALNEPFPAQRFAWIRWQFTAGLAAAGFTAATMVVGAVSLSSRTWLTDVPAVQIALIAPGVQQLPVAADENVVKAVAKKDTRPNSPGRAVREESIVATRPHAKEVDKATDMPRTLMAAEPTITSRPVAVKTEAPIAFAATVPVKTTPPADEHQGMSKGEKKPVDIASGEKLGIQAIMAEGIVMLNGRKIRVGSSLPNGEVLIATDPSKGMAETDRRVLMVTP